MLSYIAAGHRYFDSSIKRTTPLGQVLEVPILTGVQSYLLSFSGFNQETGLAEPT